MTGCNSPVINDRRYFPVISHAAYEVPSGTTPVESAALRDATVCA